MFIPDESDPCWMRAISGTETPKFELLPTKIILGRLNLIYEMDPSKETAKRCAAELRAFFVWNKDLPKAQADLKKILGEVVNK
ncbi:MAG TPA: hypothetical protein PKD23_09930 [Bellilinea sp.]|jgi:hypothetical protein|nr:hypothetical protein [Bellilinea sp.]